MRPNSNCERCGEIGVFYKRPMASGFHIGEMCSSCDSTIGEWISKKLFTLEEIESFKELECKSLGICSGCKRELPIEHNHIIHQCLKVDHPIAEITVPMCKECHNKFHEIKQHLNTEAA